MWDPPVVLVLEPILELTVSFTFWALLLLFVFSNSFWLFEVFTVWRDYEPPELVHDASQVQVRILTIDAEAVVQATVDRLPDALDDRHVIAEEPMSIAGATVHVVPEEFECEATRKGRALEWARRAVPCDREFVLFLDEDTIVTAFEGLPDADIIQFREEPRRTDSYLSFFSEMYRMGFQIEQLAFPRLSYPLYTWGGGIAVRRELEDAVTWDSNTIIEDTKFVWNAVRTGDIAFAVVPTRFQNQSPPSLREMVAQRRRWMAGSREEVGTLPRKYFLLYGIRDLSWALSPLMPILFLLPHVVPNIVAFQNAFRVLTAVFFGLVLAWCLIGIRYYRPRLAESVALVLLSPIIVIPHAAGALYGLVSRPHTFSVTEKVLPAELAVAPAREPATSAEALLSGPPGAGTVLVIGPRTAVDSHGWLRRLADPDDRGAAALMFTFSSRPADWITQAYGDRDAPEHMFDVVRVGGDDATPAADLPRWCDAVARVDGTDPINVMLVLEMYLEERAGERDVVIWFDSLSELIDELGVHPVEGLVRLIADAIEHTETTVYLHVDPARTSDRSIRLLSRAVDAVVDAESETVLARPTPAEGYAERTRAGAPAETREPSTSLAV